MARLNAFCCYTILHARKTGRTVNLILKGFSIPGIVEGDQLFCLTFVKRHVTDTTGRALVSLRLLSVPYTGFQPGSCLLEQWWLWHELNPLLFWRRPLFKEISPNLIQFLTARPSRQKTAKGVMEKRNTFLHRLGLRLADDPREFDALSEHSHLFGPGADNDLYCLQEAVRLLGLTSSPLSS